MTVNELMGCLSKMPWDATVIIEGDWYRGVVNSVGGDDGDTEVIIYCDKKEG